MEYGDYITVPVNMAEKEFPHVVKRMYRHLNELRRCGDVQGDVSLTVTSSAVASNSARVNISYCIKDEQQTMFDEN